LDVAITSSATVYFLHDPYGNILGETSGTSATRYFLKDAIGSVIAVINGSGSTVRDRYSYGPYGAMTVVSGSDYEPIGYASGYEDTKTELVKFGARYYDPMSGRWTQMDPIGGSIANPSTLNGYIYAGDDPINNADPTGESSEAGEYIGAGIAGLGVITAGFSIVALGGIGAGFGLADLFDLGVSDSVSLPAIYGIIGGGVASAVGSVVGSLSSFF
jgi:RHS repeat-associated protein